MMTKLTQNSIAQTNTQLYNQCLSAGWSESDLRALHKAYLLVRKLFPASYRPSEKPFLSHLIGVASILLRWQQPPPVVISGLLHSAYLYGNYGDKKKGATKQRRAHLAKELGKEIEQAVFHYSQARPSGIFDNSDKEVQVILLADAFEEVHDFSNLYSPQKDFGGTNDLSDEGIERITREAKVCVGETAADDIRETLLQLRDKRVPGYLTSDLRASQSIKAGIEGFARKKGLRGWLSRIRKRKV